MAEFKEHTINDNWRFLMEDYIKRIQKNLDSVLVRFEPVPFEKGAKEEQIRHTVETVLGDDIQISIEKETKLVVVPGRKFRVVESRL